MSNALLTYGLVAVLAAGTTLVTRHFLADPEPTALAAPDISGLDARLKALEKQQDAAIQRLDAATAALAEAATRRTEEKAAAAAAETAVAKLGPEAKKPAATTEETPVAMTDAELAETVSSILKGGDYEAQQMLWEKIKAAGMLEQAIAQMEEMVDDDPQNADLRSELGSAYLQKLFTVAEGPAKGTWAMKADSAFDEALKVNPQHWNARFSKAVSLSFWPPVLGKQGDAVSNFETLVQQQEASGANKPEYAQTYLFLGNLYELQGKADKAKEIWSKGAGKFPDSADLKGKMGK